MEPLETVVSEVESVERHLGRRGFLAFALFAAVGPRLTFGRGEQEFVRRMAATLIPAEAVARTGIDVLANVEHMLARGSADQRRKVLRLLAWSRRVAFLYGGDGVALGARGSRFELVQKMGKALSSLCLVAFWGDERALALIDAPRGEA